MPVQCWHACPREVQLKFRISLNQGCSTHSTHVANDCFNVANGTFSKNKILSDCDKKPEIFCVSGSFAVIKRVKWVIIKLRSDNNVANGKSTVGHRCFEWNTKRVILIERKLRINQKQTWRDDPVHQPKQGTSTYPCVGYIVHRNEQLLMFY